MYARAAASSHRHRDTTVGDNRTHTQGTQHEHNGQGQATDLLLVLPLIVTGRLSYYVYTCTTAHFTTVHVDTSSPVFIVKTVQRALNGV